MKAIYLLVFIFILAAGFTVAGQEKNEVTVKSIYRAPISKENSKKFIIIELETSSPNGFYVGGLYYCLYVGNLKGVREYSLSADNRTRHFRIAEEDWRKLKKGAPFGVVLGLFRQCKNIRYR